MRENVSTKPSAGRGGSPRTAVNAQPRDRYGCKLFYAVLLGLVLIFYGAVLLLVIHYTLLTGDIHAILCVLGFSFFCGLAILSFNFFNGWSNVLKFHQRKIVHACLNVLGLAFGIAGTVMILTLKKLSSVHGILGLITMLFAILAASLGPCAFQSWESNEIKDKKRRLHVCLGVIAFILGCITTILGFGTSYSEKHLGAIAQALGMILVSLYTLFICVFVFLSCGRSRLRSR